MNDVQQVLIEAHRRSGVAGMNVVKTLVEPVAAITDAAAQANAATELLAALSMAEVAISILRDIAVSELVERGLSYSEVARITGVSKSRISQLRMASKT